MERERCAALCNSSLIESCIHIDEVTFQRKLCIIKPEPKKAFYGRGAQWLNFLKIGTRFFVGKWIPREINPITRQNIILIPGGFIEIIYPLIKAWCSLAAIDIKNRPPVEI